ncbi:BRO family protein [Pseudomonas fulva]|uniref:BRO-N domain-containing protein n=1 Tax=Pseudomonas fulva TaxID=47880 RepID=UPI00345DFA46
MNLVPFNFKGTVVRVVTDDLGEPWFVAKDVAEQLGYVWNGTSRIEHVPDLWRGVTSVVTPSGNQQMAVLSEQGLYFFLGRSDKSGALPLQMWVAGEVIPSIRKTGSYQRPLTPAEQALAHAQVMVDLERRQSQQQEALERVEDRTTRLEQVRYLDSVPSGFETITTIRDRINRRHGLPAWVVNAVMREVTGAPLPYAFVRSRHADEGGQPFAIWPKPAVTQRFDRFVTECAYETAERATHPEISQGRFKIARRSE